MARGKKVAQGLTPEKKLAQALVPMEEQPYHIPENWCWTYLTSGVAECLDNFRSPINATERASRSGDVPYYGATGQVGWIDDYLTEEQLVLVGEDGAPFLDLLKDKAYLIEGKAWVNNHAHILRSYFGNVGNYYLLNYLNCFDFTGYVNGTTRLKLTQASMNRIPVPLAPLAEQQRIVNRIESIFAKLDEAKEKAQAVVDGFELRKSAILHKAFIGELTAKWREEHKLNSNESFECVQKELLKINRKKIKKVINNSTLPEIPSEWRYVELDDVAKQITDGEHSTPERVNDYGGYYLLSARNVRDDAMKLDDVDYISQKEYERISRRCNPQKGDVLISCSGSVGRVCVINDDNYYAMVRSAAMVSVVKCNPRFIMYMIMAEPVQREIQQLSKQTAQANLFIGAIAALKIPFAAVEEQNEIVHILDSLIKKEKQAKEAAESVLDQIDTMKKAVLARAFRGELGTNDPKEASAVELLKSML